MLSGRKVKLLVVDDSVDTCSLLAEQLEAWYDVLIAYDGDEALQKLTRHGTSVGVILLDLNMPRMNRGHPPGAPAPGLPGLAGHHSYR